MELQHINIEDLKTTKLNVRKKGAKQVADILPSIRSLGVLQPLLVRKNCDGYEIIAGQRRYHASLKLAEEASLNGVKIDPLPCIVMSEGDDAKATEASLAENIARLPMDEIDQYKAFLALVKQGRNVEEIANNFGVTERLVKQRLAIANLISPILTAYSKDEIGAETIRVLTLASKAKQKEWWELFKSDDYAPQGYRLKSWLFGGENIPVTNALFDIEEYRGSITSDLFGDESYFDDAKAFWELQNAAIAKAKEDYESKGWTEVTIIDVGVRWCSWEHSNVPKSKGGHVYVQIASDGEVTFHEGFLTEKQAKRLAKQEQGEEVESTHTRSELTKSMQNYLDLHRHSAVRAELLNHSGIALRLALAQIIAGSETWSIHADPQKANTDAISDSLATNKAEDVFAAERLRVRALLGMGNSADDTLVFAKNDWDKSHDIHVVFAKLLELDDASVNMILTFVVAETLGSGSALVEALGSLLSVDMANHWQVDETFLDLLKDKEAINACVKEVAGKTTSDAHVSSTAKVQKKIIRDCLNGTRKGKKADSGNWQPRYMNFPCAAYTKRDDIEAIDRWKDVKKHYRT